MSNGVCCIVEACCPPPKRKGEPNPKRDMALAAFIQEHMEEHDEPASAATRAARAILSKFDLVPKGLGSAIVTAYEPLFAERFKAHPPRAEAAAPADFKEL